MKKTMTAALAAALAVMILSACTGVRHDLGYPFDPRLTGFSGNQRPDSSAAPGQPAVYEQPSAEVQPQAPSQPYVVTAVDYSKPVIQYYEGIAYTGPDHCIVYPALTLDTPSARAFNEKIAAECMVELERLKNDREGPDLYQYSYVYTEQNGVIGIALMKNAGMQASEAFFNCLVYYYDVSSDRELTFDEYLEALGIYYISMIDALSDCGINFTDSYGNPTTLAINGDRYPLLVGALFDAEKTYVIYQNETMENIQTICTITEPMLDRIRKQY